MNNLDNEGKIDKLTSQVARLQEQNETQFKHISEIKNEIKEIWNITLSVQELALSVKQLAKNMEEMNERQKEQDSKIEKLRSEPADSWRHFKGILIGILTTSIVGGIIAALFAIIMK